ncbi:MAG: sulfatase-like hydrolase/transferase, partial [Blastocatellia bacterium]
MFSAILALMCALISTVEIPAAATNQRASARSTQSLRLPRIPGVKPRNVIFILADDRRYDAMGFLQGQAFLSTPQLDAMARSGAHLRNAFVTTSLCSP